VGDPRSFKRPVRVTVPRTLPTDDVLVVRKGGKGKPKDDKASDLPSLGGAPSTWKQGTRLLVQTERRPPAEPAALVLESLDDVRWAARSASALGPNLRAVISSYIPSGTVPLFAGLGILALTAGSAELETITEQGSLSIPSSDSWDGKTTITADTGETQVDLHWLAVDAERGWTAAGSAIETLRREGKPGAKPR
jgi:aconitate hydratase